MSENSKSKLKQEMEAAARAEKTKFGINNPTIKEPVILTAKELFALELPETKWIVDKVIPQGLTIFAGKPKIGKSWFTLHVALAVSIGGLALGSIKVEKGDVLYLGLEDTKRRLKDRLNKLLAGESPPENFYCCTGDWGKLPEAGLRIEKFINERKDTRLVVVDTLQKVRSPGQKGIGVYEQDSAAISILKDIADKYNVSVIVVHHQRKADSEDIFDTVSGSHGLTGSADTNIILKRAGRVKADAILHITGREVEEAELALNFDVQTGLWQLMGGAEEYRLTKQRQDIIDIVKTTGKPMTVKDIATILGKKQNTITKLLGKMIENKEISLEDNGKYTYMPF